MASEEDIKQDAIALCHQVIETSGNNALVNIFISMSKKKFTIPNGNYPKFHRFYGNKAWTDYTYRNPLTVPYLEKLKIITKENNWKKMFNIPNETDLEMLKVGFYRVEFDVNRASKWIDKYITRIYKNKIKKFSPNFALRGEKTSFAAGKLQVFTGNDFDFEEIDFSESFIELNLFCSFYDTYITFRKETFSIKEIQEQYRKFALKDITKSQITDNISAIRKKLKAKGVLDFFTLEFSRKDDLYKFKIHSPNEITSR